MLQMLGAQKYGKEKLQNAAAPYGLNIKESLKMTPTSLQQVISIAAAMTSWLAVSHSWNSYEVFQDIRSIRASLIRIIHFAPGIHKTYCCLVFWSASFCCFAWLPVKNWSYNGMAAKTVQPWGQPWYVYLSIFQYCMLRVCKASFLLDYSGYER